MAIRVTTLRRQPEIRWWNVLADRIVALRSTARVVRPEPREPIRSHAFKDDPNFWLRSF